MKTSEIRNLDELAGGALAERFQDEFDKVLANVFDPNTDPVKARKLTLTLTVKPNQTRDMASLDIEAKASLAPPRAVQTVLYIGCNPETGEVVASEVTKEIPGQIDMEGHITDQKKAKIGVVK